MRIDTIELDVRFRYESVYLIRDEKGAYGFKTKMELFAVTPGLVSVMDIVAECVAKSVKTTCTISKVFPDRKGKEKYNLIASASVVCNTNDFPVDKREGRKQAFGKAVRELTNDKQKRNSFWNVYRASIKDESSEIIDKIIDFVVENHGTEWEGEIGCPICGHALAVFIHGKHIHGKCSSEENDCLAWNYMPKKA